jgi:hypothetical protein
MKRVLFFILLLNVAEAIRYLNVLLNNYNITDIDFSAYKVLVFSDNM